MKNNINIEMYNNHLINEVKPCNAVNGKIVWSIGKSVWFLLMLVIAIIGGLLTFSIGALAVFLISTAVTLCFGHSLGMHRRLIHKSFDCPKWLEYILVHFGVLVGIAGPEGMMRTHDLRDWAQRQNHCHDYFGHKQPFIIDGVWQILCDIKLDQPPAFNPEIEFTQDKVYRWMEKYWIWQQLPWAVLFFLIGGITWVIWGVCMRVVVSVTGHWLIGYFAHNHGQRDWHIAGASVQGYNIKFTSLITMGECWHNNHHAFPGSALLALEKGQMDPGWWVLKCLEKVRLVWDLKLPDDLPNRPELKRKTDVNIKYTSIVQKEVL